MFRERAELLDFLLEVSRVTSETLDLDKLLENVASIVKTVVPYDLFAILLYNERAQGLRIRYSDRPSRRNGAKPDEVRLNEGITGTPRRRDRRCWWTMFAGSALSERARRGA